MRFSSRPRTIEIAGKPVRFAKTVGGVMEIWAEDEESIASGIGFAHAHDRLVQMSLLRLVGQGRLSECLRSGNNELRADIFARLMGFSKYAIEEAARCSPKAIVLATAYADGVNHFLRYHSLPIELRVLRYRPEPWHAVDTLLILKLMIYFLGHSQREMEKFLIQSIRAGVSVSKLQRLFCPHLDGLNSDLVDIIKRTTVWHPPVPNGAFLAGIPHFGGSNNWALAGNRTTSGKPFECHDPHLPLNFLPQAWYELVTHIGDRYGIGISIPGIPGLVMGRNNDVSVGFTYGYMDMMDFFLEDCRGGKFRGEHGWEDSSMRNETIARRGKVPEQILVRETPRGIVEVDPRSATVQDGVHLCLAWSALRRGAAGLLDAIADSTRFTSVHGLQQSVRRAAISANWVMADLHGNIGYQQSGLLPNRFNSGLYPLPGWESIFEWNGFVEPRELATSLNPECGYIATANDDLQDTAARPLGINLCMGRDRAERIREQLQRKERFSIEDMKELQRDVVSKQAKRFMEIVRPQLPPDHRLSGLFESWDARYDADSRAAVLFEDIYRELMVEVFGRRLFGNTAWRAVVESTTLWASYFSYFDTILLNELSNDEAQWFGPDGRSALIRKVVDCVLSSYDSNRVEPLKAQRRFDFKNILSPGWLGRMIGMDRASMTLEGSRATIQQCNVLRAFGWHIAVGPSYRSVTDMGTDKVETALAGGPSGNFLSRLYLSDKPRWQNHNYKNLFPTG